MYQTKPQLVSLSSASNNVQKDKYVLKNNQKCLITENFSDATATSRSSGDRFIPCRRNNNFDLFFFQKSNDGVGGLTEKLNAASNTSGEYFLNVAKEENLVKSYKKL